MHRVVLWSLRDLLNRLNLHNGRGSPSTWGFTLLRILALETSERLSLFQLLLFEILDGLPGHRCFISYVVDGWKSARSSFGNGIRVGFSRGLRFGLFFKAWSSWILLNRTATSFANVPLLKLFPNGQFGAQITLWHNLTRFLLRLVSIWLLSFFVFLLLNLLKIAL